MGIGWMVTSVTRDNIGLGSNTIVLGIFWVYIDDQGTTFSWGVTLYGWGWDGWSSISPVLFCYFPGQYDPNLYL